jgi:hypothetical protein
LSQEISKPSTVPVHRDSLTRINDWFDRAELIIERTERLVSKSKPAVVNLFLFLHLLIDLIIVLAVLVWKLG